MEYFYLALGLASFLGVCVLLVQVAVRLLRRNLGPCPPRRRGVERRGAIVKLDVDHDSKLPQVMVKAQFVHEGGRREWVWLRPEVVRDLRVIARNRREGYSTREDRAGLRFDKVREQSILASAFHADAEKLAEQERNLQKRLSLELVIHFAQVDQEIRGTAVLEILQGQTQMRSFKPED